VGAAVRDGVSPGATIARRSLLYRRARLPAAVSLAPAGRVWAGSDTSEQRGNQCALVAAADVSLRLAWLTDDAWRGYRPRLTRKPAFSGRSAREANSAAVDRR